MVTITFTKFRQNAKTYFDAVEKGEVIQVLRHGKVIAQIISPVMKIDPEWKKRPPLVIPGVSLSKVILAERKSAKR